MDRRRAILTAALTICAGLLTWAPAAATPWSGTLQGTPYVAAEGCPIAPDAEAKPLNAAPPKARYQVCMDQREILAKAIETAAGRKRLLAVIVGANWCAWCGSLQAELSAGEAGKALQSLNMDVTEIAVSALHKGRMVRVPSGDAALATLLARVADVRLRAVPFLVVINPADGTRVAARNLDDLARESSGRHDPARLAAVFSEARSHLLANGPAPSEPGALVRRLQKLWYR